MFGAASAGRPSLEQQRPADQPLSEDVLDGDEIPVPASVLKDREHSSQPVAAAIIASASAVEGAMTLSTTQSLPASRTRTACSACILWGVASTTSWTAGVVERLVQAGIPRRPRARRRRPDRGLRDDAMQVESGWRRSRESETPDPPARDRPLPSGSSAHPGRKKLLVPDAGLRRESCLSYLQYTSAVGSWSGAPASIAAGEGRSISP